MDIAEIRQVFDFILEIDKLKGIERKTKPRGMERFENSAEHSWQIALLALLWGQASDQNLDAARAAKMLLVHDLGEIDTGDTLIYDQTDDAAKHAEELEAVDRLCTMLPTRVGSEIRSLWLEFEARETPESVLAHACDRMMPIILNLNDNHQSWARHQVTPAMIAERNGPKINDFSPDIWAELESRIGDSFASRRAVE